MARYTAKLDIAKEFEVNFSLPLFTGDVGNSISLEFFNHGKPSEMTGVMIYAKRSDGTVLTSSGTVCGNKAEFVLHNNMYSIPGELQVQVMLFDERGNFLTNGILYFLVKSGFSEQSEGEGSDDFCQLTSLIRQVGEGLSTIQRAESATSLLESVFQKIPDMENQVIRLICEEELDGLTSGFAIVNVHETRDSEAGPIEMEYHYPVVAERERIFDDITIRQLRFLNGKMQQRVVGDDWKELTGIYRVKGSKETYSDLPVSGNVIGDVWNIRKGYLFQKNVCPIVVTEAENHYDNEGFMLWTSETDLSGIPDGDSIRVNLYDSNYQMVGSEIIFSVDSVHFPGKIKAYTSVSLFSVAYMEFLDESYAFCNTATIAKEYVKAGENVVWNGSEWDRMGGEYDLSEYVTKGDLGDVERAIDKTIELQQSFMTTEIP